MPDVLKQHAAQKMLSGGGFFEAVADIRHYREAQHHKTKQARKVLEPDEVMNMPSSQMVAFASGIVEAPIIGHWINHYERQDFAGKYLNNPYHSDKVRVKTLFGSKELRIIEEEAPHIYSHLPQYQHGIWRYVEGFRPSV